MLYQTLQQVRGKNKLTDDTLKANKKCVIYFQTDELSILNKAKAPFHIDGDPAETPKSLNIKMKKNCFRLIQP